MGIENEQELEIGNESDASEQVSSEPADDTSSPEGESKQAAPEQQTPKEPPFHEHPRFKEIIEQRNQASKLTQELQAKITKLEQQMQSASKPAVKDEFVEELAKLNPAWAKRLQDMDVSNQRTLQLEQELQSFRQEQTRQQAVGEVNRLHEENKVSPELRELYNNQLDAMARAGLLRTVEDVSTQYKKLHADYTKMLDSVKKSERESYVTSKKGDSKIPASSPKTSSTGPAKQKVSYSKDPEEARAQMAQRFVKATRESGSI